MISRGLAVVTLAIFIFVTLGALFMPPVHMGHGACPFALGSTALCTAPLAHREHWQSTFSVVLLGLLAYALLLFVTTTRIPIFSEKGQAYARVRKRTPDRPAILPAGEIHSGVRIPSSQRIQRPRGHFMGYRSSAVFIVQNSNLF